MLSGGGSFDAGGLFGMSGVASPDAVKRRFRRKWARYWSAMRRESGDSGRQTERAEVKASLLRFRPASCQFQCPVPLLDLGLRVTGSEGPQTFPMGERA